MMVGPEFLLSINKRCFFMFIFARGGSTKWVPAQLTLSFVGQAAGPQVAPPSMFYEHNCIEVRCVESGMASSRSR